MSVHIGSVQKQGDYEEGLFMKFKARQVSLDSQGLPVRGPENKIFAIAHDSRGVMTLSLLKLCARRQCDPGMLWRVPMGHLEKSVEEDREDWLKTITAKMAQFGWEVEPY